MGQGASVRANTKLNRKIGDAELAAIGKAFVVWSPTELRKLLAVFREITGGALTCNKRRFLQSFSGLYGFSTVVQERVFDLFDANKDGSVDFEEFVRGLTVCQRGRPEERIRFLFEMYSGDKASVKFDDVIHILWDAAGQGAQQGHTAELRALRTKSNGQIACPIKYLTDDADAQRRIMTTYRTRAQLLFDSHALSGQDLGAGAVSDSESDDEDEENGSFTESKFEEIEAKRAESTDSVHVPPLRLSSLHDAPTRDRVPNTDLVASFVEFSAWCMSGILQYQDVLKRLNPIPTVQEEGSVILSILQAACADHLVEGTVWCAVSMRWWQRWMDYCCRGDDVMRALTGNSVLGLSHSALSPFRTTTAMTALSTPIVGTRVPGNRRISERASVLGHFSSVLPEVGRAIYEGGAFTGAEAVAGSGKRASRVAHNAFDRRGTLSSAAPHRSGSPSSPALDGPASTPTRRSVLVPVDASTPPAITNTPQFNGLSTPTRSLASLGRTLSFGEMNGRPGPIDNSDLQGSQPDLIRLDAVEHEDFVLIPDAAWTQLVAWYGGGPTFPRFVVDLSTCSEVAGGDTTKHMEVDVWPIPLSVMYSFPDKASSGSLLKVSSAKSKPELTEPVLHIRVSAQKPWVEVFASLVELKHALDNKSAICVDSWPAVVPLSQQIIATIRSMSMEDYRLHVQSVMSDEVLHYRADTRDPLDTVENSFLVGGELIVLEKRALTAHRPVTDGAKKSPRISSMSLPSKASVLKNTDDVMSDGWTLASIKGPQLWTEVEVGDYIDADVAAAGTQPLWKAAVVLEVASHSRYHVSVLEGSTLSNLSHWVTDSTIAPFRTRSGSTSRQHQRKATVHYALDSAILQAASRKLSALPLPVLTASAKSLSIGNDLGAIPAAFLEGVQVSKDVTQRRRTYKADVTFRRQSMAIAASRKPVFAIVYEACCSFMRCGCVDAVVRGSCGLKNLGNTCFMASVLQCLNSAPTMTEYFLSGEFEGDVNESNPLGLGGRLAEEYGKLLKEIWSSRDAVINPLRFKVALSKFAPQFSGHNQHDCQELLAFLLDGLHEDLNRISKKPYVEALDCTGIDDATAAKEAWRRHLLRDQSMIVDLFQGQLKSTLTCLNRKCGNKSVTFEPFMSLSLPVPADAYITVSVTVIPRIVVREEGDKPSTAKDVKEPRLLRLRVPRKSRLTELLNAAAQESGIRMDSFIISDVYKNKIYKTISDTKRLSSIRDSDTIVLHETDPEAPVLVEVLQAYAKPRTEGVETVSSRPRVACSLPFILSCTPTTTNQQVYEAISLQLSHWTDALTALDTPFSPVSGELPHFGEGHSDPATQYYRIVVVNSKAGGCGLCRKGGQCDGCELPHNDQKIELIENTAICVEWTTDAWSRLRNRVLTPPPFIDEDGLIGETAVKLTSLLDDYVKEEVLTGEELWYCPKCEARQSSSKKLSVWAAPHYLVIHLKRFAYTQNSKEKIHRPVEFPIKGLDLSKWTHTSSPPCCDELGSAVLLGAEKGQYQEEHPKSKDNNDVHLLESKDSEVTTIQECDDEDVDSNPTLASTSASRDSEDDNILKRPLGSAVMLTPVERPPLLYDLLAVSSHMGTMGGGHYTSAAQSSVDGNWYLYDDDVVKPFNPQAISASDAYVLFYRRRV